MTLFSYLIGLVMVLGFPRDSSAQTAVQAYRYAPQDLYSGSTFFDNFTFFTAPDPTNGCVQYIDRVTAQRNGLISYVDGSTYIGVDYNTTQTGDSGRQSVRIRSNEVYSQALIIGDFGHMPGGEWVPSSMGEAAASLTSRL